MQFYRLPASNYSWCCIYSTLSSVRLYLETLFGCVLSLEFVHQYNKSICDTRGSLIREQRDLLCHLFVHLEVLGMADGKLEVSKCQTTKSILVKES